MPGFTNVKPANRPVICSRRVAHGGAGCLVVGENLGAAALLLGRVGARRGKYQEAAGCPSCRRYRPTTSATPPGPFAGSGSGTKCRTATIKPLRVVKRWAVHVRVGEDSLGGEGAAHGPDVIVARRSRRDRRPRRVQIHISRRGRPGRLAVDRVHVAHGGRPSGRGTAMPGPQVTDRAPQIVPVGPGVRPGVGPVARTFSARSRSTCEAVSPAQMVVVDPDSAGLLGIEPAPRSVGRIHPTRDPRSSSRSSSRSSLRSLFPTPVRRQAPRRPGMGIHRRRTRSAQRTSAAKEAISAVSPDFAGRRRVDSPGYAGGRRRLLPGSFEVQRHGAAGCPDRRSSWWSSSTPIGHPQRTVSAGSYDPTPRRCGAADQDRYNTNREQTSAITRGPPGRPRHALPAQEHPVMVEYPSGGGAGAGAVLVPGAGAGAGAGAGCRGHCGLPWVRMWVQGGRHCWSPRLVVAGVDRDGWAARPGSAGWMDTRVRAGPLPRASGRRSGSRRVSARGRRFEPTRHGWSVVEAMWWCGSPGGVSAGCGASGRSCGRCWPGEQWCRVGRCRPVDAGQHGVGDPRAERP